MTERKFYFMNEVQRMTGLGQNQIYRFLKNGNIPNVRMGKRFLIPMAQFDALWNGGQAATETLSPVKRGRPPKPERERKTCNITLRVSPELLDTLGGEADSEGVSLSEIIRRRLSGVAVSGQQPRPTVVSFPRGTFRHTGA